MGLTAGEVEALMGLTGVGVGMLTGVKAGGAGALMGLTVSSAPSVPGLAAAGFSWKTSLRRMRMVPPSESSTCSRGALSRLKSSPAALATAS